MSCEHNCDRGNDPKSQPTDKFIPVNRDYWYIAHPYLSIHKILETCLKKVNEGNSVTKRCGNP